MNQTSDARQPQQPQIQLPGCKSLSQRALILAASGAGQCRLRGLSSCDDSRFLLQALRDLGVSIDELGADSEGQTAPDFLVSGIGEPPRGNGQVVDVGEAGSSLRFLLPWCAAGNGEFVLTGAPRLFERPHGDLIDFLTAKGAKIQPVERDGRPGLRIQSHGLAGGRWQPPCRHSSQYISGLAMAANWLPDVQIEVPKDLPSRGYFDLTLDALKAFPGTNPEQWQVPGDPSGATFFLSALAMVGGSMQIGPDWSMTHPEAQLLQWFEQSALLSRQGETWQRVNTSPSQTQIHLDPAPDAGPALAVLGAFLPTGLILHGVRRLRIKESDRVLGIQRLLETLGGQATVADDALHIEALDPSKLQAIRQQSNLSYHPDGDHRLAMAAGIAQLRVPELQVEQPDCVAKSFPDFWQQLSKLATQTSTGSELR